MLPRGAVLRGGDLRDGVRRPRRSRSSPQPETRAARRVRRRRGARARRLPPRQPPRAGAGRRGLPAHRRRPRARGDAAQARRDGDRAIEAPFEPEAGAYAGGHQHARRAGHGGKIHEYGTSMSRRPCEHDHDASSTMHGHSLTSRACCSSRARRCRSARTATRRASRRRSRRASCTTPRARSAGSATCSSIRSRALEAPLLLRADAAWRGDDAAARSWNALFLASRETAELRAETRADGLLARAPAARELGVAARARRCDEACLSRRRSRFAAARWGIDAARRAAGLPLVAGSENQVMAAVKAVPLGQTAGQRMLLALGDRIDAARRRARCDARRRRASATSRPASRCCRARHETQYSRLFRS